MITPQELLAAVEKHTNVLLYGPPGTGKSHLMKEVQNLFEKKYGGGGSAQYFVDTTLERGAISESVGTGAHSRWVTFHQGYSYEDFIIGLRPKPGSSTGTSVLSLEARAGALLDLAARARDGYGLMLIDEVNRGNASRIFGEFITLMEMDKRLNEDGTPSETTVTVTLPYLASGESVEVATGVKIESPFSMPRHIYTLASMNSVDKSVAPLDAAMRRRFYVVHLRPDEVDLAATAGVKESKHSVATLAVQVMMRINRGIGIYLGPDYMLGQYYLPLNPTLGDLKEDEAKKSFVDLWRHKIVPQLLELFQARPTVCVSLLRLDEIKAESGVEIIQPSEEEVDEGASSYVMNAATQKSDEEIYAYLEQFVAVADSPVASGGLAPPQNQ